MKVLGLILLLLSISANARNWEKIKIPGAKCGDGTNYFVFYSAKNSKKLLTEFMGGGACWSLSTCLGPNLRTWIHPIPKLPSFSTLTSERKELSPFTGHSALYFPYCTGDVHAGDHTIDYRFNVTIHHRGFSNVLKTVKYLKERDIIQFDKLDELILFGVSAGALGSLIHSKTFEKELAPETQKFIISDSPGLHFGKTFWDKFTKEMIVDFDSSFSRLSLNIDFSDGMIAQETKAVCKYLKDWTIGFLQGSEDLIMSSVFGNITPKEHSKNVYSKDGIYQVSKDLDNCAAFVPDTKMHTFLILEQSARIKAGNIDALDFVRRVYSGKTNRNFR